MNGYTIIARRQDGAFKNHEIIMGVREHKHTSTGFEYLVAIHRKDADSWGLGFYCDSIESAVTRYYRY
jgi:hypothetical protein